MAQRLTTPLLSWAKQSSARGTRRSLPPRGDRTAAFTNDQVASSSFVRRSDFRFGLADSESSTDRGQTCVGDGAAVRPGPSRSGRACCGKGRCALTDARVSRERPVVGTVPPRRSRRRGGGVRPQEGAGAGEGLVTFVEDGREGLKDVTDLRGDVEDDGDVMGGCSGG